MDEQIDLAAFEAAMIEDVKRFTANWLEGRSKHPAGWPMEMGEGDWFEQFLAFIGS